MWVSDILIALELMLTSFNKKDLVIDKIENHFIYFTNGERIAFHAIEGFMEKTGRKEN